MNSTPWSVSFPLAGFVAVAVVLGAMPSGAHAFDWNGFREDSVVEIITVDDDGRRRETKIWIVVLDQSAFVRTNDSHWLANIRRDPAVHLRTRGVEAPFTAEIDADPTVYDRVEQAFKDKYGLMQKVMSAFRIGRPTVMRITPRLEP